MYNFTQNKFLVHRRIWESENFVTDTEKGGLELSKFEDDDTINDRFNDRIASNPM